MHQLSDEITELRDNAAAEKPFKIRQMDIVKGGVLYVLYLIVLVLRYFKPSRNVDLPRANIHTRRNPQRG